MRIQPEGERVKTLVIRTLCLLCLGLLVVGAMAEDTPGGLSRLHPALRILVADAADQGGTPVSVQSYFDANRYAVSVSAETGEARIGVLVKLAHPFFGRSYGGLPVLGTTGSVLGMDVTVQELMRLLGDKDVVYVEPAWKTAPHLDASVPAIGADEVHGLSPAVLGEGVIVGAVDTGIDYSHLDFRYDSNGDGFEESSRFLAIWDQTFGVFGVRYLQEEIEGDLAEGYGADAGSVRQADRDGHGTHVMSIAAGDGSSSEYGFVGVAPKASLVMVKTTFFTSDILRGVEYVFDVADSLGLPAVVNLSLGGHEGAHDGTSLFEQGLDELAEGPGRAIVVSAGNEGDLKIHASSTLYGGSTSYEIDPQDTQVELSIWYPGDSRFTVTITPPGELPIAVPWGTETGVIPTPAGLVRVDNAWAGVNPNNGDNEAFVRLYGLSGFSQWRIAVSDMSGGGRFDVWVTSGTAALIGGDSTSTIDEPGNADNVITVGAYTTKATWPSQSGNQDYTSQYAVGTMTSFSSRGPTRDGRMKPELAAPGAWVCGALSEDAGWQSTFVHPDGVHTMEVGTSMAAPHVSGAIALMFSVEPDLTTAEIRSMLTSVAVQDGRTGSVPNPLWGWGKLDVAAAVEEAIQSGPEPPPETEIPAIEVGVNPVSAIAQFAYSVPEGTTTATLRIYDVTGALVYEAAVDPAVGNVSWNLQTDRGEMLASGLYLYVLVTDRGTSEVGRLVIAR
jgi:subtilisin family serine protease